MIKSMRPVFSISCLTLLLAGTSCFSPGKYLKMAGDLVDRQKYTSAIELYDRVLEKDSANTEALMNAGMSSLTIEGYSPAKYYFGQIIKMYGTKQPEAFLYRGMACQFSGSLDYAVEDYTKYLSLKGATKIDLALFRRATCYFEQNRFDAALADCDTILKLKADDEFVHELRGDIFCRKGEKNKAGGAYKVSHDLMKQKNSPHLSRLSDKLKNPCSSAELAESLQKRIDNAHDGDTVRIAADKYTDHIVFDNKHSIALISTGGTTYIETADKVKAQILIRNSSGITISGFKLIQAEENYNTISIEIENSRNITIVQCEISGAQKMGVYAATSENIHFKKCRIGNCSSGISLWDVSGGTISDCCFWKNGFHYVSRDITTGGKTAEVPRYDINRVSPGGQPLFREGLSQLDRIERHPLFTDYPYILTGDFNGDGTEDYALQTTPDIYAADSGITIAIFCGEYLDTVKLPVNQNLSWSKLNGVGTHGDNFVPDTIKVGFNTINDYDEGKIIKNDTGFEYISK